ncbi:hypothetical protein KFK09_027694 [Dendrobium nobile]|uniref:Endonuclease/exonuclease/phosphatase domain-containing protein n=1 Tax=Dendrobium nobile TaxID=94219 RepID=A0A8T3A188_DENNO|nr:hypothetical protein KFK09_027694 [Dendrobium nobile]
MSLPNFAVWNTRGFNSPNKVNCCKQLVKAHNLDLLIILEAKITSQNLSNHWFQAHHKIFPKEASCDNFTHSNPGRIWVKWNEDALTFTTLHSSSQFIHGIVNIGHSTLFAVTAIYASNLHAERQVLWKNIQDIAGSISLPWVVLDDFNCCRNLNDKVGGTALSHAKLRDFNSMVFNTGLQELSSVGHFFTWHNQQQLNPIHIKLDRALINDSWISNFPNSFYKVGPECSDHSPLILLNSSQIKRGHHFLYKIYSTKFPEFWSCLMDVFSQPNSSSPLSSFNFKLKTLKNALKNQTWSNANSIQLDIDSLTSQQHDVISQIQLNPLDHQLNCNLKIINSKLAHYHTILSSWIAQRAKVKWLTHGEDDLKFLYAKINISKNHNCIKEISSDQGTYSSHKDIANVFINISASFSILLLKLPLLSTTSTSRLATPSLLTLFPL